MAFRAGLAACRAVKTLVQSASLRSRRHILRCPVCERPALLRRSNVSHYALRACPECRLEFLDPQPDDSVLAGIYSTGYFLGEGSDAAVARRSKLKVLREPCTSTRSPDLSRRKTRTCSRSAVVTAKS